jgi:hypothetical protein
MHKTHLQPWRRLIPLALVALMASVAAILAPSSSAAATATISGHVRVQEAGHIQEAWSTLDTSSSSLTQVTYTEAYNWFNGFTNGAFTILRDGAGTPIYVTHLQAYGVNGTLFGNSKRWDVYTESIPTWVAARTASVEPQVLWAPGWGFLRWVYSSTCSVLRIPCPPLP